MTTQCQNGEEALCACQVLKTMTSNDSSNNVKENDIHPGMEGCSPSDEWNKMVAVEGGEAWGLNAAGSRAEVPG